jgi:hypothetical protein
VTTLVRTGPSDDQDLDALRARVAELETVLGTRAADVGRIETELAAFKISYRQQVGLLHEELDELELALAEAELGELAKHVPDDGPSQEAKPAGADAEPAPRYTSDAVRTLFRDVAKAIHPDLAGDDQTRDRRHSLMIEANRAYALGDEERLRFILQTWERSPEAVQGSDADATRQRLIRRISQIEEQLAGIDGELEAFKSTPMWQLKTMVDEAAAQGKDLVRDMVTRLKRDILVARNRLDAMQSIP